VLDEELGTEFRLAVSCAVRNPPVQNIKVFKESRWGHRPVEPYRPSSKNFVLLYDWLSRGLTAQRFRAGLG
jgi:hypothetical protein